MERARERKKESLYRKNTEKRYRLYEERDHGGLLGIARSCADFLVVHPHAHCHPNLHVPKLWQGCRNLEVQILEIEKMKINVEVFKGQKVQVLTSPHLTPTAPPFPPFPSLLSPCFFPPPSPSCSISFSLSPWCSWAARCVE
jgi:hypothetical protein